MFGTNGARVNQKGQATVAAWRSVLDEVDPNRRALWIGEGEDTAILDVFDGIFPYSIAWAGDPAGQLASYAVVSPPTTWRTARRSAGSPPRCPATTTPTSPVAAAFAVDRARRRLLSAYVPGHGREWRRWVMITSFNEWLEGHQIEPSTSYGTRFLDLTRELPGEFRAQ